METRTLTNREPVVSPRKIENEELNYEKFKEIIKESQKGDLIEGEIRMKSPARYSHEKLFGLLYAIMKIFVSKKKLGQVLGSRTLVRIDEKNGYEPDILFVSKDRLEIIKKVELAEAPDLAVEIISKSSRIDDRVRKFLGYQKAGVKEYWLIDVEEKVAEFYENIDGEFAQMDTEEGIFKSKAIEGFWLKMEWLFQEINEFEILQKILEEPENK